MKLYAVFPLARGLVCASIALYELLIWPRRRANLYELAFVGLERSAELVETGLARQALATSLQGSRLAGEEAQSAIMSSRNQILSMALVHEDLYRLVTRLVAALGHLSLGVDQAIPCGRIVNELCTNVLKHAFPKERPCTRREPQVELPAHEGSVTLAVADNGIGMPPEVVPESATTLGMQIISRLVKQLNGTMRLVSGGIGSRFEIAFPVGS